MSIFSAIQTGYWNDLSTNLTLILVGFRFSRDNLAHKEYGMRLILPDPKIDPQGYRVVSDLIMHGPCGAAKMSAPCTKREKCSKNFLKKYTSHTFFDDKGHVHYQRRDTNISITKHHFSLDNSYVVPYNRALLLAFEAHINVEYCGWSMLIKYLFKYISKGTHRIFARVSKPLGESSNVPGPSRLPIDEIQNYLEGRFVCTHEACWRILNFDIHRREPVVQILAVYLQGMQRITFRDRDNLESIVNLPGRTSTTLTEWFAYNEANKDGRHLIYQDFPSEFVWESIGRKWATIFSEKFQKGKVVLAIASSGIAYLLLPSGRTAHSRFKLSLEVTEESLCRITKNSHLRKLLANTDLIIWDEAPMNDRRYFEALDRSLRDILTEPHSLFGVKSVLLGGDFIQKLPVKKGASKMEVIPSCISESELWSHFKVFTLTENMRLEKPNISVDERSLISSCASWLLNIGDGNMGDPDPEDPKNTSWVDIPVNYLTLQQKAIVCLKNETADTINSKVLEMVQGKTKICLSHDEARPIDNDGAETEMLYPVEHLNTLKLPGYPPHRLELKVGAPVMLLRNMNVAGGL
nr:DNA helicase [Tanacetum cinerariifolium]